MIFERKLHDRYKIRSKARWNKGNLNWPAEIDDRVWQNLSEVHNHNQQKIQFDSYVIHTSRPAKEKLTDSSSKAKQNDLNMLSLILLVAVTNAITPFDYFGHNCSSYFALSFLKIPPTVEESFGVFKADSEVVCASRCCHHRACTDAVLCKAARRCSLYNAKETIFTEFQTESQEARTAYIRIKKVG